MQKGLPLPGLRLVQKVRCQWSNAFTKNTRMEARLLIDLIVELELDNCYLDRFQPLLCLLSEELYQTDSDEDMSLRGGSSFI